MSKIFNMSDDIFDTNAFEAISQFYGDRRACLADSDDSGCNRHGGWPVLLMLMAVGSTLAAFLVGMAFTFILLVALPPAWNWLMGE